MTKKRNNLHIEKTVFYGLCCACLFFVGLYMYFVSASVHHVVMRQEIEKDSANIRSEISDLESKFIEAQHKVSSDIASMQGYHIVSNKVFIDRSPASLVLSSGQ